MISFAMLMRRLEEVMLKASMMSCLCRRGRPTHCVIADEAVFQASNVCYTCTAIEVYFSCNRFNPTRLAYGLAYISNAPIDLRKPAVPFVLMTQASPSWAESGAMRGLPCEQGQVHSPPLRPKQSSSVCLQRLQPLLTRANLCMREHADHTRMS